MFQQCNDDIKNQMPPSPSESEVTKYTNQFERCAIKCKFFFLKKKTLFEVGDVRNNKTQTIFCFRCRQTCGFDSKFIQDNEIRTEQRYN